jgi:hypothetical protein
MLETKTVTNGHSVHVYLFRNYGPFASIIARSRWPQLIFVSLDVMSDAQDR